MGTSADFDRFGSGSTAGVLGSDGGGGIDGAPGGGVAATQSPLLLS